MKYLRSTTLDCKDLGNKKIRVFGRNSISIDKTRPVLKYAKCSPMIYIYTNQLFLAKTPFKIRYIFKNQKKCVTGVSSWWFITLSKLQAASQRSADGKQFFWTYIVNTGNWDGVSWPAFSSADEEKSTHNPVS